MLVEDEENLHLAIKLNLELENYNVTSLTHRYLMNSFHLLFFFS